MRPRMPRVLIIGLILILLIGSVAVSAKIGWIASLAAPFDGPVLSIPLHIQSDPNSTVNVPVQFTGNGFNVSSTVFSIDYDETYLSYDSSIPGSITLTLPADFVGACQADVTDIDGEIDCFIYDPLVPLAALPDSTLVTVILRTLDPPYTVEARAGFSAESPPASFGDTEGQSVGGTTQDGSVKIGEGTPISTPTPTPTQTHTPSPSPTPTMRPPSTPWGYLPYVLQDKRQAEPQPTPKPTEGICNDLIENSGFENKYAWDIPITEFTASYSDEKAHHGDWSMYTGIDENYTERGPSYSSARQKVTLPSNSQSATLEFWTYSKSDDSPWLDLRPEMMLGKPFGRETYSNDIQYFIILDEYLNLIQVLDNDLRNDRSWEYFTFNVSNHIGRTIWVEFGTYNDGDNAHSALYLDDVVLDVCK
jgi:hypothetical protein